MRLSGIIFAFTIVGLQQLAFSVTLNPDSDWAAWRGPTANGKAASGQNPPTEFGEDKNVVWRVPVPGRGHASPTVVGDKIFLTTADEQRQIQAVVCFDRATGKRLWARTIHRDNFPLRIHKKNTHASGTVACNGKLLFTCFYNEGQVKVTAMTIEGKRVWSKPAGDYTPKKYEFGFGSSPLLHGENVIVAAESDKGGSFIVALAQSDGEEVWRVKRRADISFSSPIVAKVADQEQLLISGQFEVSSFDPLDGRRLWSVPGTTQATCGTIVWDGDLVFASGGYPTAQTIAVKADGSEEIVWTNKTKCYEQSMLAHDGYVYGHADGGIMYCWRASDGEEMWKKRLGGDVSSSPTLANGHIYAANEVGHIFVIKATPESYQEVSRTQLGDEIFASPTFVDNRIYYRVATGDDHRAEFLYCIGNQ